MDIWGLISAYLITQYWGWILLIIVILLVISEPIIGLYLLIAATVLGLLAFLSDKYARIRDKRCNEAWNALSDYDRTIWEGICIYEPEQQFFFYGKYVFDKRFAKEFSFLDCFDKNSKIEVPFPKHTFFNGIELSTKAKNMIKRRVNHI